MAAPARSKVRLKDRRRKTQIIWWSTYAVVGAALVGVLAYAVRLPSLNVQTISVTGTKAIPTEAIQSAASVVLSGSYAWLVPKSLSITAPTGSLAAALMAQFPEIERADANLTSMTELTVVVIERSATALWCDSPTSDHCYRMDKSGFIYKEADGKEGPLRRYSGLMGEEVVGKKFDEQHFTELSAFIDQLEAVVKKKVRVVTVNGDGDVFVTLQGGGEVRFVERDIGNDLLPGISAVFNSPNFKRDALDYADFRFGKKAVVKFK